jgi:hypothetical protein
MKILSVWAEFFHADGRTDRHDEVTSRFSKFGEGALKISQYFEAVVNRLAFQPE